MDRSLFVNIKKCVDWLQEIFVFWLCLLLAKAKKKELLFNSDIPQLFLKHSVIVS